jgi:UDP-glucose 4-epimerase
MRALVTGGAGFIGSHVAELLLARSIEVVVLDDLSMGRRENVPAGARLIVGDVTDPAVLAEALRGVEVVFHQAAKVSIRHSIRNFVEDSRVNIQGTVALLRAAAEAGVRKLVVASSMAVYGDAQRLPISEDHPCEPTTPYGISKLAAERYVLCMGPHLGIATAALRYFNTYGTRQTFTPYVGVMTIFIRRLLQGLPPVIFGSGEQIRDFVWVRDVARANLLAMDAEQDGIVCNIGTGVGTSVNELNRLIQEAMGVSIPAEHAPPQPGEPADSIADIARARELLGYEPQGRLEERIAEVIAWNREQAE